MGRAERILTDGTGSVVLGANALSGMGTRLFVVMANDAITVRTVSDEVDTVDFLALSTRLCMRITEHGVVVSTL